MAVWHRFCSAPSAHASALNWNRSRIGARGVTGVAARSIQWLLTRRLVFFVDDIDQVGLKREIISAGRRLSMGANEQPVFSFDRQRRTKTPRNAESSCASGVPPIGRNSDRPARSGEMQISTRPAGRPVPTGKPIARKFARGSASMTPRSERKRRNAAIPTRRAEVRRSAGDCRGRTSSA
jgi:hypothetical protein